MNADDFDYGRAIDRETGEYVYAWHRERDVALIWHGGEYAEVTVSGTWQPGKPVNDALGYEMLNMTDAQGGKQAPFTPEGITGFFIASGQAGS